MSFDLRIADRVSSSSEAGESGVDEDWEDASWAGASEGEDGSSPLHWGDGQGHGFFAGSEPCSPMAGAINDDEAVVSCPGEEDTDINDSEASAPAHGNTPPFLWEVTDAVARGRRVEGGDDVRVNEKAQGSNFYPFPSLTVLLLFVFTHTHRMSRQVIDDLFFILRYSCTCELDGSGSGSESGDDNNSTCREFRFDPADVPQSGEHFLSRTRRFLPLLDVFEDTVPSTGGGGATSKVYSFPLPVILDRLLRSAHAMEQLHKHATGHVLRGEEARRNLVAADHVFPVPTRNHHDRKECNLNGDIARGCALYTADGVVGSSGKKLFPGDVCSVHGLLAGDAHVCRILELYFDKEENEMRLVLRRFRTAQEVYGERTDRQNYSGLPCVWEEVGKHSRYTAKPECLGDLVIVLTSNEVDAGLHDSDMYASAELIVVGVGFCERRRPGSQEQRQPSAFIPKRGRWSRTGTSEEHLVDIRTEDFFLNEDNLPYASMPLVCYYDKYNATDMTNQVVTILRRYQRLLRKKRTANNFTLCVLLPSCARFHARFTDGPYIPQ